MVMYSSILLHALMMKNTGSAFAQKPSKGNIKLYGSTIE